VIGPNLTNLFGSLIEEEIMVPDIPLHIERGTSFDNTLQWLGGGKFIGPIEDLLPGFPTTIRITAHSLNASSPIANATRVDADWFTVPVATVGEIWVPGTGEIAHFLPANITGWGGECNIRKNWHSPVLHTISTALGTMTLDGTDGSVRLQIASNVTDTIELVSGVYDIDLWSAGGARPTDGSTITRVFKGPVFFHRDS
jgi:hypothetical protein